MSLMILSRPVIRPKYPFSEIVKPQTLMLTFFWILLGSSVALMLEIVPSSYSWWRLAFGCCVDLISEPRFALSWLIRETAAPTGWLPSMSSFIIFTNFFWSSWSLLRFSATSLFSNSFLIWGLLKFDISDLDLKWPGWIPVALPLDWLLWCAGIGGAPSIRIKSFPFSVRLAYFSVLLISSTRLLSFFRYSSSFDCWVPIFCRTRALIKFSCLF